MNSSQMTVNAGDGIGFSRRLPAAASARSSGSRQKPGLEKVGADPVGSGQVLEAKRDGKETLEINDRLEKGPAGRAATAEWRKKAKISQGIEKADQALADINEELKKAKEDLTRIVKMYPPYPQGSKERAKLLSSYLGLRKQIEKLTVPPDNDVAAEILGGRNGEKGQQKLAGLKVDVGPDGLGLAFSGGDLQDKDLPPLIKNLVGAEKALLEKRAALRVSAAEFFGLDDRESDQALSVLSAETREQLASQTNGLGRSSSGIHRELALLR